MLVTLEKAGEILAKGSHAAITTTDGKIALVPKGKETLKLTSTEAVNMMFYVVRSTEPAETVMVQLEEAIAKAQAPDPAEERARKYREIRGT
ncbi:hypothetical protein [Thermostichus vulcanus]|uniref:Uncharacterized protein n=1 Tax=Thermostichus vulcanus str. 'Rupite' TaxID=2813851 RepID=A0ABT0CA56_THEVL|nr:hypothetical protein [Thermostichus vulcanus]MCJ2542674.1 hypothetical protein [Thermostichus vulcanus str. 'Rupite']